MKVKELLAVSLTTLLFTACQEKNPDYAFRNPDLSVEERVEDLLSRLTLEEKIGQMMNQTPAIERLGIPPYDWWNEALHGVARAGQATVFPQSIGMAATFDEAAVFRTFDIISDEARAKFHHYQQVGEYDRYKGLTFWTPNINIFRDPRWGRGMETYGEDPYLTGRLGLAVVKGLQGDDPTYFKSHACAKHYAIHSGPEWNRHEYDAYASPRDLWETYLPAFEQLVTEGNVQEVMCAYNRFEGVPCCSNDKLLNDILRNQWGFDRIILSDCGAIDDFWQKDPRTPRHETHPDKEHASADAVRAGTDLECGNSYRGLLQAVQDGLITEEDLDVSLRRLIRGRIELGMFDPDSRIPWSSLSYDIVESPAHVAHALEMARKSMVLLKNRNNILPLDKNIRKIAVVGPNAADSIMLWANYNGYPSHTVTILEGIRNKVPQAEVIYEMGCNHAESYVMDDLGGSITSEGAPGFTARFYNNEEFEGDPVYTGQVQSIHYTTGGHTQFAPHVNLTHFTARFDGVFTSPVDGDVELDISGNDGFRIYIGEEKVAEMWTSSYTSSRHYTLQAEKGKSYPIRIEYMQRLGSADLNFTISQQAPVNFEATADKVKEADVILFVGGLSPRLEGEELPLNIEGFRKGDRTNIEVPAVQRKMIQTLQATGKPVIHVVCAGSALALAWEDQHVDAILNAWYGGQEAGTAVADVLFGDYNPGGRLPVTFYRSTDQLPDFEDYSMKGRTYRYMTQKPLYPFGYGLSYTTFRYDSAILSQQAIGTNDPVQLTMHVTNTGDRDGEEVVQVYIRSREDKNGPVQSLKAFRRIPVKAGATEKVEIELLPEAFETFNDATQRMEVRPGLYEIAYGGSSDDASLNKLQLTIR